MTPFDLFIGAWLFSLAYTGWLLWAAPLGYEDDSGFHYGSDDD